MASATWPEDVEPMGSIAAVVVDRAEPATDSGGSRQPDEHLVGEGKQMKYRRHDEVRAEFVRTPEDEAEVAAFKEEALSTIRRYVEAIGGKLEIVADFGEERLLLG
jgi:hypothetical protein